MNQTKKQAELRTIILDKIYAKGPISRIDISKETGITPATVSAITGSSKKNCCMSWGKMKNMQKSDARKSSWV